MSGGIFDYKQYHISDIRTDIETYLDGWELDNDEVANFVDCPYEEEADKEYVKKHHRTIPNKYGYTEATLAEFRKGIEVLKQAEVYAQRIDWLLSGDDGEEAFHERLKEDLEKLRQ